MIETFFFYMFASVLIASGASVVTARNPVYAVLFLIAAFFNAAGLFIMLGAEFVAMILVIVYVGAVAVLFLFVVMMLDIDFIRLKKEGRRYLWAGSLVGGVLMAELFWIYTGWKGVDHLVNITKYQTPNPNIVSNTHAIGEVLYTHYVYLFQVSGLILLVAMIGAITLAHRQRPGVRRQDIQRQLDRKPSDVVKLEDIETGAGIS